MSNRPIAILTAVFVTLAVYYSLIIPIFEGPDEDDHFRYVKFVADHRTLPIQLFEIGGGQAGHQGWQPPLYYALAALLIAPVDTSDFSEHLMRNEYVTFVGDPACCGRNIYYHFESENFPYLRTTLAVHMARWLSVLFGAITVVATFALVRAMLESSLLALAAASVVAFNPSFLFASALVSNDSALAALSSLTLLVWVKLVRGEMSLGLRSGATLGAIVGIALLFKTTALGLVPLSVLLLAILAWRKHDFRVFLSTIIAFSVSFALLIAWWFVRNHALYGDPLAARLVSVSALFPRAGDLTWAEFFQISLPQFWTTFWGGPTPSDFSPAILILLAILTLVAAVGAVHWVSRSTNYDLRITIYLLAAWLAFLFVAMIQFIRTTQGGDQGRYLFPAISVFALLFVVGLNELAQKTASYFKQRLANYRLRFNSSSVIGIFVIALFLFLALFVPFAYTLPAYAQPALLSAQELARFSGTAPTNFGNQIELLGYELSARSYKPGESLRVVLYWRALAPMQQSYRVFVHLLGMNQASIGGIDVIPARGAFPTLYWKPGDALRDTYTVPVPANAIPGKYSLEIGLYPIGKPGERLSTIGSGDDRVLVTGIKIAPLQTASYAPSTRVDATFSDQIDLLGYDAATDQDQLRLILYWRGKKPMDRDYTVFVHALDSSGKIIAQIDRQPQQGNYPTSIWDVGENVKDEVTLQVPMDIVATGPYKLELGLYDSETHQRLPLIGTGIPASADAFIFRVNPGAGSK